jgi:heme A synthase
MMRMNPFAIARILLALVLLLAGLAVAAFGVMTVMYSDPVVTSVVVFAIGLLLLGAGAWLMRRRRG